MPIWDPAKNGKMRCAVRAQLHRHKYPQVDKHMYAFLSFLVFLEKNQITQIIIHGGNYEAPSRQAVH
jgi:hypothetical protein